MQQKKTLAIRVHPLTHTNIYTHTHTAYVVYNDNNTDIKYTNQLVVVVHAQHCMTAGDTKGIHFQFELGGRNKSSGGRYEFAFIYIFTFTQNAMFIYPV